MKKKLMIRMDEKELFFPNPKLSKMGIGVIDKNILKGINFIVIGKRCCGKPEGIGHCNAQP
jgi:hypothetical protein